MDSRSSNRQFERFRVGPFRPGIPRECLEFKPVELRKVNLF